MKRNELLRLLDEAHAVLTPVQIAEMSISMDRSEVSVKAMLEEATAEWEALKETAAAPNVSAHDHLLALMNTNGSFGAADSEGWHAVGWVEQAAAQGKPFPLHGANPFQLYESYPGWQDVSAKLVQAAEEYWKSLVQTKLGITIR